MNGKCLNEDFFKIGFISGLFQLYLAMFFFTIGESIAIAILLILILVGLKRNEKGRKIKRA